MGLQNVKRSVLKKMLWKYVVALKAVEHVQTVCRFIQVELKGNENHPMYYPAMTALCVIYSKPFTDNEGIGALPLSFLKKMDPELGKTHRNLLAVRHHFHAHANAVKGAIDSETGKEIKDHVKIRVTRTPSLGGINVSVMPVGVESYLLSKTIPRIMRLCQRLDKWLQMKAQLVIDTLYKGQNIPTGFHDLNLNDET